MDFFDTVANRHSIRAFQSTTVEQDKIDRILDTINRAPSAGDLQAYQVLLVTSRKQLESLAQAAFGQTFIIDASLALVFCAAPARAAARYGRRGQQLYAVQDATIACAYAQLAATSLGLASTWVGAFDEEAARQAIGVPKEEVPVAILPIGYANEEPLSTPRRTLDDLIRRA